MQMRCGKTIYLQFQVLTAQHGENHPQKVVHQGVWIGKRNAVLCNKSNTRYRGLPSTAEFIKSGS